MQLHKHVAVKVYVCVNTMPKDYVQNVLRVLKCKLKDVDATALPLRQ